MCLGKPAIEDHPMFTTAVTKQFGLKTPIVNAGMAMIARPELAAAVSNAGGLGTIGCDVNAPEALRAMITETRALTGRPFGVDLIGDFLTDGHIDVIVAERVPLAIFFWTPPSLAQVFRLKEAGTTVWMQIGTVVEAREAVALGVDGLIVQGAEGGGHNRAEASTMTLFPRIRALHPTLPLIAAGGIVSGATMAAALVLGADAVWCGSRFLASIEADAHEAFKRKVLEADVGDTIMTRIYGPEWPDQPMRAIVNEGARSAIGREAEAIREAEGQMIGTTRVGSESVSLPCYSVMLPTRAFEGDIERACLTAGQSVGNIAAILPAAEIVQCMTEEALAALARFQPEVALA
jgi:NAD(P)H-dependent flavin oxidoreductase YrpB (nitropropane dioxygenase family)